MTDRPVSAAAERNRQPILDVLRLEFKHRRNVLEVGSGTGQHAVYFASELPGLVWQTSDVRGNHAGIRSWISWAGLENVLAPLDLDVSDFAGSDSTFDAVFSANTAHIMNISQVENMFSIAGGVLEPGGIFILYGPINLDGAFTSDSNARFDAALRRQDAEMGIRDLEVLNAFARSAGLTSSKLYAMPSNNMIAIWTKEEPPESK